MISGALQRSEGETQGAFAARVLARAKSHGVDIRELALDAWELPDSLTPAQTQILGAFALLHVPDEDA